MSLTIRAILAPIAVAVAATTMDFAASSGTPKEAAPESVEWVRTYSQALAQARRTGKPIFLEFRCRP
jgi:hypothetical protein